MENKRKIPNLKFNFGAGKTDHIQKDAIAFFDLETTGVGSFESQGRYVPPNLRKQGVYPKKQLQLDVGIYSVSSQIGEESTTQFGRTDVPVEKGAQDIYAKNLKMGLKETKKTEKEMLRSFVKDLQDKGIKQLAGYNVANYDVPLLMQRLEKLGLTDDLKFIQGLDVVDLMPMSQTFIDEISKPYHGALGWDDLTKKRPGFKLEHVAAGFGIDMGEAHLAKNDVSATVQLLHKLETQEGRAQFNVGNWWRAVEDTQSKAEGLVWESRMQALEQALDDTPLTSIPMMPEPDLHEALGTKITSTEPVTPIMKARAGLDQVKAAIATDAFQDFRNDVTKTLNSKHARLFGGIVGGLVALSYAKDKLTSHLHQRDAALRSGIRDQANRDSMSPRTPMGGNYTWNASRYLGGY